MTDSPPWLDIARAEIGTREIPGPKHSSKIMGWIAEVGARALGIPVNDDETPWCGTFMAMCMRRAGLGSPPIAVRASAWGKWGRELINPRLGCVLVFQREGGGHVGLYVGEDDKFFHVLGGNQANSVNVMKLAKSRLVRGGMRWPNGYALPVYTGPHAGDAGVKSSVNES